jgi:glycosyltransferase involved in cell wall biosynthesis
VPVVATAVGGTPEVVVNGQTGFLVAPGDAGRLAARIIDLLRNPDWAAAFGQAARRRMADHFSFAAQARAYQAVFAELVPGRRGRRSVEVACA